VADDPVPVLPSHGALRPLGLSAVRLAGGFWGHRQRLNADAVLPHCDGWVERSGAVDNLRAAAHGPDPRPHGALPQGPRPHRGREFADSDVYKLLEALSWESGRRGGDTALDGRIDDLAAVLAAAQQPDGYLNSRWAGARYTDLEWGHELYCYGHLIQAAVARLRCHGEDRLTDVARRAADHVCAVFGADERTCGHPVIETALVELYRATGVRRYLDQARRFVERRGYGRLADIGLGRAYYQDDLPVRERQVFAGHAVREFYFACGAVDVAVETGDDGLLAAVLGQWERTVAARTYLTGGTGSRHEGESFGADYELPPDRAYGETCAAIGSVMLSWRLLLATGEPRFADQIERTLFNAVAAGVGLDGRSFFYSNPLQVRDPGPAPDPDRPLPRACAGRRAAWFDVSCCPPNLARTLASLAGYQSTVDSAGIQVHQLWPASIATDRALLSVQTGYPWRGDVTIRIESTVDNPWRLSVRVPAWAAEARLDGRPVGPGYATVQRAFRAGDTVQLRLPVAPRWTWPDPRIDAVRGCVAMERGPLVYCAESPVPVQAAVPVDAAVSVAGAGPAPGAAGSGAGLVPAIAVDPGAPAVEHPVPELGAEVVGVTVAGGSAEPALAAWPYLPHRPAAARADREVSLVPYPLWANRGAATMRVFLPVADS
jgi:DUF1680 family protein